MNRVTILFLLCLLAAACAGTRAQPTPTERRTVPGPPATEEPVPTATVQAVIEATPTSLPSILPTPVRSSEDAISSQNIEQVALISQLGKGAVNAIAFATDGQTMAIATSQGVYLYDAQTLADIASYPPAPAINDISPRQIAFNHQGDLLALEESQGIDVCNLVLWRLSAGKWQQVGQVEAFVECLAEALSPDGEYLASVNYDTRLASVWRTSDMALVQTLLLEYPGDIYSIFVQLAFSGADTLVIGEESFVSVYDLLSGELLKRLEEPGMTTFNRLAISQDGRVLAARDFGTATILVWNLSGGSPLALQDAPEDWMMGQIRLSPAGDFVASAHTAQSGNEPAGWVDLWRTSDGAALPRLSDSGWDSAPQLSFTPDGTRLVTWKHSVDFWRVSDGTPVHSLPGFTGIDGVLSPDGTLLAEATGQQINLYRLNDGQVLQTLEQEQGGFGPGTVVFSPDGSLLASKRVPGLIHLWGVADGSLKNTLEYNCSNPFSQAIFSPDGKLVAVYANSPGCRGIAVWRTGDGQRLYEFEGAGGDSLSFSPDSRVLVVEDERTGQIAFVRVQDGAILQKIPSPKVDEFGGLLTSFSPDGRLYAIAATIGALEVWQIGADEPLYSLTAPFEWTALAFSPDGQTLVTASDTIQVRDAHDGSLRFSLAGQPPTWGEALFSPDGKIIASVDQGMIRLWSLDDGSVLHSLEAQPPAVFSLDGQLLASSGAGLVRIWRVDNGKLLRSLETNTSPATFSADGRWLISMRDCVVETWGIQTP